MLIFSILILFNIHTTSCNLKNNGYNNTKSNTMKFNQTNHNNTSKTEYYYQFTSILTIYCQYFLIFLVIFVYKLFEEISKLKNQYAEKQTTFFQEINSSTKDSIKDSSVSAEQEIFASGKPEIIKTANDPLFSFGSEIKPYAKIERVVEYMNIHTKKTINNEDVDYNSFPDITSAFFFGEVELYSIKLSPAQLKHLKNKEKIYIDKDPLLVREDISEHFEVKDGNFIVYSKDKNKKDIVMKIALYGYPCVKITIVSKLFKNEFRTLHIPAQYMENSFSENSSLVNKSISMVVQPNISYNPCNIFLCFCFNPYPVYTKKENCNSTTINWVSEEITTKNAFFAKKYGFSRFFKFFMRFLFYGLFLVTLFFFKLPLHDACVYVFGMKEKIVDKHYWKIVLIAAKIIELSVFIYVQLTFWYRQLSLILTLLAIGIYKLVCHFV